MTHDSALSRALFHANRWLQDLDAAPVAATTDLATLRARIDLPLNRVGIAPARVVDELVAMTDGGLLGSAGGRFFAWVIGGSLDSALAADWLTSTWEQNAVLHTCGPAVSVVEERAGEWVKELLELPREASFGFTTGCQLAHFTCLAAARHRLLLDRGHDAERDGLFGAPRIRVLTSELRHGSIDRAARFLGLGTGALEAVAVDDGGAVRYDALEAALRARAESVPTVVVLDAADLNVAAFDSFERLVPLAKRHGAWVHVDGAFGLFARASRAKRAMVAGVELADSWATDAHKWLNVPFDCGIAIVRDRAAHRAAMTLSAPYITAAAGARDAIDWTPEWSRRARGVSVYAALRELGREGVERLVDRCCAHCSALVTRIGALPGAEVAWAPRLNQGLVRFLDPRPGATETDHDAWTDRVVAAVNQGGAAFFSGTSWNHRRAMRVSVVNWRTSERDVDRAVEAVRTALAAR